MSPTRARRRVPPSASPTSPCRRTWTPRARTPSPARASWCATARSWAMSSTWAQTIQQAVGGDLLRIETVEEYPLEHEALVDFAARSRRPTPARRSPRRSRTSNSTTRSSSAIPTGGATCPRRSYTFLESYDLSGKTIIPFCPHGGSGFSRTQSTIAELQPNATVREDGLALSRNDVADSAEQVTAWGPGPWAVSRPGRRRMRCERP